MTRGVENLSPRGTSLAIAVLMFSTGAAGLVFEYILSTVSSYILGNTIEQFSVTIAVMMLFMGIAGSVQQIVPDRQLAKTFVAAECLLALAGGFSPIILQLAFAEVPKNFLLIHYSLAALIGFLVGIEIPLILRLNAVWTKRLSTNLSNVLTWDYVGAFLGALIWAFLLLRLFSISETAFLVAISNFAVAAGISLFLGFRSPGMLVLMGSVVAGLLVGLSTVKAAEVALEQRLYADPIVYSKTTRYQHLVLTHDPAVDDWRLFINGNLQFSSLDEDRYHELLVHPPMATALQRTSVLILGGGDGLALRRVLNWPDVKSVMLVDIDPDMIRLFRTHPDLIELNGNAFNQAEVSVVTEAGIEAVGTRQAHMGANASRDLHRTISVVNVDAHAFVRAAGDRRWDVIIVDLPDPNSVELTKLYSVEFYRDLSNVLSRGGTLGVQATSPYYAKEAFLTILRTIGAAGFHTVPYHMNVPSFGDWGFILAWRDRPQGDVLSRLTEAGRAPGTTFITAEIVLSALAFGRHELETDQTDINKLMRPVLLDRYRFAWTSE